ncbi:MAG: MFS transporter [Promethearchaeota archaeon]|nr:MAG: MFS transporter [Candidatus Lokiarchaeota archaeon]
MKMSDQEVKFKDRFLFALNGFPDLMTYQFFQATVFVFYFTVIGIETFAMWIGYIIWGFWNMFNDPLLGYISDRKKYGKYGKRKYFIIIAFIPLCLMMIFLFTVPTIPSGIEVFYFIFIIILFELVYTLFDVNTKSLFPEMWPTEQERSKTNVVLRIVTIFAILTAFMIPSFLIPDIGGGGEFPYYIMSGIIVAIIVGVTGFFFVFFGIKEKEETQEQREKRPTFFKSLKMAFKNKNFVVLVLANMFTWFVLNMLTSMFSLYCTYVLGISESSKFLGLGPFLFYGISIVLAFVVAAIVMPLHKKIGLKYGMRTGFMITMVVMALTFIPFLFYGQDTLSRLFAIINAGVIGFGISGIMFYFDILMGYVIDEDEEKTGVKRSASFYGTNAFIHRFSIILFISSVYLVFQYTAWQTSFVPTGTLDVIIGLQLLLSVFPAIACVLAFILMYFFRLGRK